MSEQIIRFWWVEMSELDYVIVWESDLNAGLLKFNLFFFFKLKFLIYWDKKIYFYIFLKIFDIKNIIARPNLLYIVCFGPYRPHGFVSGDASSLVSLTPQNTNNRSATSTTHKALTLDARFRCGISQSLHLKTSRLRLWYQM